MSVRRTGPGVGAFTKALGDLDRLEARAGWFETARDEKGVPVASKAVFNEFGTAHIPPRPFMRPTVAEKRKAWMTQLGEGAKAILRGETNAHDVLERVALTAAGDVAVKISEVTSPPLSPKTVARKGSKKPLVETGQMLQSVTGVVVKRGKS